MQSGNTPKATDEFANIQTPDLQAQQLQLQQLVQQGVLTPEQAGTVNLGSSDMNNITTDPNLKSNQMDALLGLQNIAQSGGMTAADKANLAGIQTDEATQSKGARDAILQNAQARGMGGSGLEMLNQLTNQQNAATNQSARDLGVAGQAQARALQSLVDAGTQSGNMQAQDFNQKAAVANSNDAISKFNAQNQQQQINTNAQANNVAQATNLAAKQGVADSNTNLANQQQQYNKQLLQTQFQNQMAKAGGQQGAANQAAAAAGANSTAAANANNSTIGSLLGAGAAAYGSKAVSQAKKEGGMIEGPPSDHDSMMTPTQPGEVVIRKQDVPDLLVKAHTDKEGKFDAAAFLDTITGHKYGYGKKG